MTTPRLRVRRSGPTPSAPGRDTSRDLSTIPSTIWVLDPGQLPRDAVERYLQDWMTAHGGATTAAPLALSTAPTHSDGDGDGDAPEHSPARPFWADMLAAATNGPGPAPMPTRPSRAGPARGASARPGAPFLVVEQGATEAGDDLGRRAAQRLAPGGLLAVLSHHSRGPAPHDGKDNPAGLTGLVGVLRDPTGSIVASAQNADLLYLQHIVLVAQLPAPVPAPVPAAVPGAATDTRPNSPVSVPEFLDATGEHTDLCVFLRPPAATPAAEAAEAAGAVAITRAA